MAQVNRWVRNSRILIIVPPALNKQNLKIRVRFREASSRNAGSCAAACENNVDFAGGVLVGGHCGLFLLGILRLVGINWRRKGKEREGK